MNSEDDSEQKETNVSLLDFAENFLTIYTPPYKLFLVHI